MAISYKSSSDDILTIANKSIFDVTKSLNQLFTSEFMLAQRDSRIASTLITRKILDINNSNEMLQFFYTLAEEFHIVQAIYWGDIYGNYISAEYEDNNSISSYSYHKQTPYPHEVKILRNIQGNIINTIKNSWSNYDPRSRPWFTAALENKKPIWTDIYLYEPAKYLGITLATPVYEKNKILKGVLGMDIRLDWISWYLDGLKISPNGIIFVVQQDGKLIAYPQFDKLPKMTNLVDIHDLPAKWVTKSFDLYKKNNSNFIFKYNGKMYLSTYQSVPTLKNQKWLIGIVAPEDDFIGELNKARITNVLISVIILLLGMLLISKLVNNIVNPVKSLIKETGKIKNFELEGDVRVQSRIKEILLLSNAIYTMKVGLKTFKRYVPAELVKRLIKKGENAELGGSKKPIVAFFSDIKDFTKISHESDPNQIMSQLNEYFDTLTAIILHEKGTVDKYIGDSIMAFWGAPDEVKHPCHHAANAALRCMKQLNILNEKWKNEGRSPFYTRIGIHFGEAIVGNVGSSERINYTAIGDSINIASRLEGINKDFHTTILVSEVVYDMIKNQFELEEIGWVSLRGITEKVRVYALIGYNRSSMNLYKELRDEYETLSTF